MDLSNISVNKQSSIRITGSKILYFDPFEIGIADHDADYIFITHEHFDHFDPISISKIINNETIIIAPESMKKKVIKEIGIDEDRGIFCKPNEMFEINNLLVNTKPAYNNHKPFHNKSSKWLGYIVKMDQQTYYIAGDTDVNEDIKNVECDVALVPIGGHYTMDKRQAAEWICGIGPKVVIPTHYGDIVGNTEDGMLFSNIIKTLNSNIQVEIKL